MEGKDESVNAWSSLFNNALDKVTPFQQTVIHYYRTFFDVHHINF
jgi:hypothetical protein